MIISSCLLSLNCDSAKRGLSNLDFREKVEKINPQFMRCNKLQTLDINVGNICNQQCEHCHVQAGPNGKKLMSREFVLGVIDFLRKHGQLNVDITGGCPELNPEFRFFVENVYTLAARLIVRTNLTVFFEQGLDWVPKWYRDHNVVLMVSMPCYMESNVDQQRGIGVFEKSIMALKLLNKLGYGFEEGAELNLVYNPMDDFLPISQQKLEDDYKRELGRKYGIRFNNLFTITNAPIGRFKQYLEVNGRFEKYDQLLEDNFNAEAAENIMCRDLVSVDYRGVVYNCDFNQALGLPIIDNAGISVTIDKLEDILSTGLEIITDRHCFCCTAGAGSSCTGSLVS